MMANLNDLVANSSMIGQVHSSGEKSYTISKMENFSYEDPVDKSISKNQVSANKLNR